LYQGLRGEGHYHGGISQSRVSQRYFRTAGQGIGEKQDEGRFVFEFKLNSKGTKLFSARRRRRRGEDGEAELGGRV
jgi:hypothetical protein